MGEGGETFRLYDENKKYEDEVFSISGSELVILWRENVMVVVILPRVLAKIGWFSNRTRTSVDEGKARGKD